MATFDKLHGTTLQNTMVPFTNLHGTTSQNTMATFDKLHGTTSQNTVVPFTNLHITTVQNKMVPFTNLHITTLQNTTVPFTNLHWTTSKNKMVPFIKLQGTTSQNTVVPFIKIHGTTSELLSLACVLHALPIAPYMIRTPCDTYLTLWTAPLLAHDTHNKPHVTVSSRATRRTICLTTAYYKTLTSVQKVSGRTPTTLAALKATTIPLLH